MSEDEPCVLVGVTGCIAAYKSCEIVRALQKEGVRVKVVMTEHAREFIGATTFRALTHESVGLGLFNDPCDPVHHISLAQECDVFLIAPASANTIAKIALGIADDLLTTTALACSAPLVIAPAMNTGMYEAAATQENLSTLADRGAVIVDPCVGALACGDVGKGHIAETETIVAATLDVLHASENNFVNTSDDLAGLRVLVTAGPTVEPIDAVRFISNYSSGKMGYALARAAARRGAQVDLVSGPVSLEAPVGVKLRDVNTADEMLKAAKEPFGEADIAIFAAAVTDMRPAYPHTSKLKKETDSESLSSIELVENPDVLSSLAHTKTPGQCVVGFAAETEDVIANAQKKLDSKGADIIVANQVSSKIGFGTDDNKAWIVSADGIRECERMSKDALADIILDAALEKLSE